MNFWERGHVDCWRWRSDDDSEPVFQTAYVISYTRGTVEITYRPFILLLRRRFSKNRRSRIRFISSSSSYCVICNQYEAAVARSGREQITHVVKCLFILPLLQTGRRPSCNFNARKLTLSGWSWTFQPFIYSNYFDLLAWTLEQQDREFIIVGPEQQIWGQVVKVKEQHFHIQSH